MSDADPAASLIGAPPASPPAPAADPASPPAADPAAPPAPGTPPAPSWLDGFSAQADGEGSSNRDWLAAKGFKDPDALAKGYRALESEYGRVKGSKLIVPGEGATAEERKAFATAIGVPDTADAYQVKAPVGADGQPIKLNEPMLKGMREAALAAGVPKGAFEAQVGAFIQSQLDEAQAETVRQDGLATAKLKEWGAAKDAKVAAVGTAMRALGLTGADGQALRGALGADRALDLMAKLGEGMAEDTLLTGGSNRFGITAAEAQKELDTQNADPAMAAKLANKSSPEYLRRQRLLAVVGAAMEKQQAA